MKAWQLLSPGVGRVVDVAEPEPQPGQVLLRIRRVGLCGSDLNSFLGRNPLVCYPRIPGHEIGATIEAVTDGVPSEFHPGMDVTVIPYTACSICAACRRGRAYACERNQTLGVQRDGALAERLVVPWEKLVPSEGLPLEALPLVEPLSVGFHAIQRARVQAGETVVVIGCGGVGLGAVMAAYAAGAHVVGVDVDPGKLKLALCAGARATVANNASLTGEEITRAAGGRDIDVVVEAVGGEITLRQALEWVAFTGRVVCIGYPNGPVCSPWALAVKKELDVLGSRNAEREDFIRVIEFLRSGAFPWQVLISREVSLDATGEALAEWASRPAQVHRIQVILG